MAEQDLLTMQRYFDSSLLEDMSYDELDCADPLELSGRCDSHKGLRIEITEHPHTMRQVANIVIALQRMKCTFKAVSTEFSDHELLNIIMENVVEESVVMTLESSTSRSYRMDERILKCTICDDSKKTLIRFSNPAVPESRNQFLLAVTLSAGNLKRQVWFHLSAYTSPVTMEPVHQPVCLGIVKSNLYLSCIEENNVPTLRLEEVKDRSILKTIHENGDMERFLFFRQGSGESVNTFESVKFRGWFLSTAQQAEYEPVKMCQMLTDRIRAFNLNDESVVSEDQI